MDVKANDIEAIVRQVLTSLKDTGAASTAVSTPMKTAISSRNTSVFP